MLVAGVDHASAELMRSRRPLFLLAQLAGILLVVLATRKRPLEDAMLLALPLALVLMNPLNYHDHFVFLLVLLGARRGLLVTAPPLLVMCVAGYWIELEPDAIRRFELLSALIFACVGWLYFGFLRSLPKPSDVPSTDLA